MPRIKAPPHRKRSSYEKTRDSINESVLDDEEIRRLERELDSLRREKAKQIRKMRFKRVQNTQLYNVSLRSSSEFDAPHNSDEEEEELRETFATARQSTRELADGFERAQQRFMFNVQNIEEKYREREQRGLPESKVEIDRHGNFYFPETMTASRQQAFVNRMYQNDALFGKGSASAPRNSIQSFEGDTRALEKSLQLDKKFGKKLDRSESFGHDGRGDRIYSSAYVSGIPKKAYNPSSNDCRYYARYTEDLDDDVFDNYSQEYRPSKATHARSAHSRRTTSSATSSSFHNDFQSETDGYEFDDDGELSSEGESKDESLSNEEEDFSTPVTKPKMTVQKVEDPLTKDQDHTPQLLVINSKATADNVQTSPLGPAVSFAKREIIRNTDRLQNSSTLNQKSLNENQLMSSNILVKEEVMTPRSCFVKASSRISSRLRKTNGSTEGDDQNSKHASCIVDVPPKIVEEKREEINDHSVPNCSLRKEDIRRFFEVAPKAKILQKREIFDTKKVITSNDNKELSETETSALLISRVDPAKENKPLNMPLERPVRKKKPTAKVAAALSDLRQVHSHDHSSSEAVSEEQKDIAKTRKRSSEKSPFCKHCEYVKEENRKSKLNAKQIRKSCESHETKVETSILCLQKTNSKEAIEKENPVKNGKRSKHSTLNELNQQQQIKRRSGPAVSEEPEKKKQSLNVRYFRSTCLFSELIDSDLLSIPSSMAIIVDTELIATENPSLSHSHIPMFSETSPSTSVWNSNIDVQWIRDVKKLQSKAKVRRFFGVPVAEYPKEVPVINFWVENLLREDSTQDPFVRDYRRIVAQDKKARIDVKAGYDVRF